MASLFDLAPRLTELKAAGLEVSSEYKGSPAQWLQTVLTTSDVHVVNAKGAKPDDVVCMVKLSTLEDIVAKAKKGVNRGE